MISKKPNLIILGPQGSGKSTQAELLVKKYAYNLISSGNILRTLIKKNNLLAKKLSKYVSQGKLVPVGILINKVWLPHFKKINLSFGLIIEGTPRNISQAHIVEHFLLKQKLSKPWLIYLKIRKKTIYQRLKVRKICVKCNMNFKPGDTGYNKKKCIKCNGKLVIRQDDTNSKSIEKRIKIFYKNTKKVINYYRKKKRLIQIDGEQSITDIHKNIVSKIKKINND